MPDRLPEPIAMSEDDPLAWFARNSVSRRTVKRAASENECGYEPPRRYKLERRHLRQLTQADCPVSPHTLDEYGDPLDDDCICGQIEEGWWQECDGDRPDAIAVWRAEPRGKLRYRFWSFMRRRVYPSTDIMGRRPVIWGGRLNRRATWLDRLLIGTRRGGEIHCGDRWLKPRETELRWCRSCRAITPHEPESKYGVGPWCLAMNHGESKAASFAEDVRHA